MPQTTVEQMPPFAVICQVNGGFQVRPALTREEVLRLALDASYEERERRAVYRRDDDPRQERIQNPAVLAFDPTQTQDKELKQIFADEMTRTLWCAIGQKHLRSQDFNAGCLRAAELIRQRPPKGAYELMKLMLAALGEFRGIRPELWVELLPYVQGKKALGFIVEL